MPWQPVIFPVHGNIIVFVGLFTLNVTFSKSSFQSLEQYIHNTCDNAMNICRWCYVNTQGMLLEHVPLTCFNLIQHKCRLNATTWCVEIAHKVQVDMVSHTRPLADFEQ